MTVEKMAGRLVGRWVGMMDSVKVVLTVVGTAEWKAASLGDVTGTK